jgi:electron transport complex protein RnfD
VALLTFLFPRGNDPLTWMLYQVLGGGLLLGAFFMATDYVTSPLTKLGQIIYGIGCGVLTVMIRYFGGYNEGVSYAILCMNLTVVLLDRIGRPMKFGAPKKEAAKK